MILDYTYNQVGSLTACLSLKHINNDKDNNIMNMLLSFNGMYSVISLSNDNNKLTNLNIARVKLAII